MSHPYASRSSHRTQSWPIAAIACAALLSLSACNDKDSPKASDAAPPPANAAADTLPAPVAQPVAYSPPSADVLYQMVAPIALYPDKLIAQILAGATYPDQVTAAEAWLGQNPALPKTAMVNAVNAQSWDPSIKSLTQFPNVLEQMASNLPWTKALGKAYYNDPADVLNAIQVMRNRAYKAGSLKSSKQLNVKASSTPSQINYAPADAMVTPIPQAVIAPPTQYIEIAPPDMNAVYVPQYNPAVVYGQPLPVYHGYSYMSAPPVVGVGVPIAAGVLGFGAGILLAQATERHPSWGWHSWDMHWGDGERREWRPGTPPPPPMARPAVVYNQQTYISQSRTVVQNIQRTDNVRVTNVYNNSPRDAGAPTGGMPAQIMGAEPHHGLPPAAVAAGIAGAGIAAATVAGPHRGDPAQNHRPDANPGMRPAPAAAPPEMRAMLTQHQADAQRQQQMQQAQQAQQQALQQQHRQQQAQMQSQQQAQREAAQQQRQQQLAQQQHDAQQAQMQQRQQQAQRDAAQQQRQQQMAQQQQREAQQAQIQQQMQQRQQQAQREAAQQQAAQQHQEQQRQQAQMQAQQQAQQNAQRQQMQAQREAAQQQRQQQMAQMHAAQMQQRPQAHADAHPHGGREEHPHR